MGIYDHVDIRVRDRDRARTFYGTLLPALGLTAVYEGQEWTTYAESDDGRPVWQRSFLSLTEKREHAPSENCIAFRAASRAEVDRLAAVARAAGAGNVDGPAPYDETAQGYYAVFFEDPDGNRLEICHREED